MSNSNLVTQKDTGKKSWKRPTISSEMSIRETLGAGGDGGDDKGKSGTGS